MLGLPSSARWQPFVPSVPDTTASHPLQSAHPVLGHADAASGQPPSAGMAMLAVHATSPKKARSTPGPQVKAPALLTRQRIGGGLANLMGGGGDLRRGCTASVQATKNAKPMTRMDDEVRCSTGARLGFHSQQSCKVSGLQSPSSQMGYKQRTLTSDTQRDLAGFPGGWHTYMSLARNKACIPPCSSLVVA